MSSYSAVKGDMKEFWSTVTLIFGYSDLMVFKFTELVTRTYQSLSLQNWQQGLSGLWVYRTGNRDLLVFEFTGLATGTYQSLSLQDWQQGLNGLWVYRTGNRDLPAFD